MKKNLFLFLLLMAASAFACKSKSNVGATLEPVRPQIAPKDEMPQRASVFFEMKRTACFGTCPIYNVSILENGEAFYEGKNFVDKIGFYHTTLDKANLQKIYDKLTAINYFSFLDEYNSSITDLPSVYTTVNMNGQTKTIHDRHKGPKELDQLYQLVDEILDSCEWSAQ